MVAERRKITVRVRSVTWEAEDINSYELCPVDDDRLPSFTAGSHVDVFLPNGLVRNYSLTNRQGECSRYIITVHKSPAGQGGSQYVHERIRPGDLIEIGAPRNNFELEETAAHTVLIAGGIGITPIWAMIQRLEMLGRSWELHYCARTRIAAAFLEPLTALETSVPGRVHLNFDHEPGGQVLDLVPIVAASPDPAHLYCCGPAPMLEAFRAATADLGHERAHVEYFTGVEPTTPSGGFIVVLARSGRVVAIPPGRTILEVLQDEGVEVMYSCQEGICGSCETRIIEGIPEHRDHVLSDQEQASNQTMMICCSGCKGEKLVLDL